MSILDSAVVSFNLFRLANNGRRANGAFAVIPCAVITCMWLLSCSSQQEKENKSVNEMTSIYDFEVLDAKKQPYDLKQHKGKPLVIYNVASKCGFTKGGYETAQALYAKYKSLGFTVLAFPCNQFGSQEPGTEEEIQNFACSKFSAEFPIMAKVDVNGDKAHPLYEYLKKTVPGILGTTSIKWNFTSFLVDENGVPIERYSPGASTEEIEKKLVPILDRVAGKAA